MLLIDHFENTAAKAPDRLFLHFLGPLSDLRLDYGTADRMASMRARHLQKLGLGCGTKVGMLLGNSPEWVLWYLANQKLGCVTTGLNLEQRTDELAELCVAMGVDALLCDAAWYERAKEMAATVPGGLHIVEVGDADEDVGSMGRSEALSDDDPFSIVFTSGTTGARPKGVLSVGGNVERGVRRYQERLRLHSGDRVMVVTPLCHATALHWGFGLSIVSGGALVLAEKFSRSGFWEQAERAGATVVWTMSAVLFMLLTASVSDVERRALQSLRVIFGVGAASRYRDIAERWGPRLLDGYGSSEVFGTLTDPDCFETGQPYPCAGRLVPGVELQIHDPETGRELPVGQQGEIVSPFGSGFVGYVNAPEATAESIRGRWFRTGDMGFFDQSGRLFFVDRIKDVIRFNGMNISAHEVEQVVKLMPGVAQVVAVGQPDSLHGERVAVCVVPAPEAVALPIQEIQRFCQGRLAPFKIPVIVHMIRDEQIPRTSTGKVKRYQLKRWLVEGTP